MTDHELIKLCADAMGLQYDTPVSAEGLVVQIGRRTYNPLRSDAQAMALVKKFRPNVHPFGVNDTWFCFFDPTAKNHEPIQAKHADLNRAIVECVATWQRTRA